MSIKRIKVKSRKLQKCSNIFLKIASLHKHATDSNHKVLSYYTIILYISLEKLSKWINTWLGLCSKQQCIIFLQSLDLSYSEMNAFSHTCFNFQDRAPNNSLLIIYHEVKLLVFNELTWSSLFLVQISSDNKVFLYFCCHINYNVLKLPMYISILL